MKDKYISVNLQDNSKETYASLKQELVKGTFFVVQTLPKHKRADVSVLAAFNGDNGEFGASIGKLLGRKEKDNKKRAS